MICVFFVSVFAGDFFGTPHCFCTSFLFFSLLFFNITPIIFIESSKHCYDTHVWYFGGFEQNDHRFAHISKKCAGMIDRSTQHNFWSKFLMKKKSVQINTKQNIITTTIHASQNCNTIFFVQIHMFFVFFLIWSIWKTYWIIFVLLIIKRKSDIYLQSSHTK